VILNKGKNSRKQIKTSRQIWPLTKRYYSKIRQAKDNSQPIAWAFAFPPPEILHAMDIPFVMPEHYSSVLSAKQQVAPYLEITDQSGYPMEACSYHRAVIGFCLSGDELIFPSPDFIFATNFCDPSYKALLQIIEQYRVPYYMVDVPFCENEEVTEEAVEYCFGQLEEFIDFATQITGMSYDVQKLYTTCELANRCYNLWAEINELRKNIPCPMGVVDEMGDIFPMMQLAGTKEAVAIYEMLLAELRERVAQGESLVEEEKHRLIWVGSNPIYDNGIMDYFEEFGAVLVKSDMDCTYTINIDMEDPLKSLARKMISNYWTGSISKRIKKIKDLIRDYQADGLVLFSHRNCRSFSVGHKAVKDAIQDEFSIPVLNLEGDMIDLRGYNSQELRNKIEAFIEIL
jgi:benzoyl-CoA reductase/2-hydroxyglutaryl-CoA dehydratase subunit BcrC/BadD/HgdB